MSAVSGPIHHGSCHCGAVRFTVEGPIEEAYTCDCSLCQEERADGECPRKPPEDHGGRGQARPLSMECAHRETLLLHAVRHLPLPPEALDAGSLRRQPNALDDFDSSALPVRDARARACPSSIPRARRLARAQRDVIGRDVRLPDKTVCLSRAGAEPKSPCTSMGRSHTMKRSLHAASLAVLLFASLAACAPEAKPVAVEEPAAPAAPTIAPVPAAPTFIPSPSAPSRRPRCAMAAESFRTTTRPSPSTRRKPMSMPC